MLLGHNSLSQYLNCGRINVWRTHHHCLHVCFGRGRGSGTLGGGYYMASFIQFIILAARQALLLLWLLVYEGFPLIAANVKALHQRLIIRITSASSSPYHHSTGGGISMCSLGGHYTHAHTFLICRFLINLSCYFHQTLFFISFVKVTFFFNTMCVENKARDEVENLLSTITHTHTHTNVR